MHRTLRMVAITVCVIAGLMVYQAEGACKVVMSNGNEFTAEACRKVGNQVEIELESGTILLPSGNVRSMRTYDRSVPTGSETQQKTQKNGTMSAGQPASSAEGAALPKPSQERTPSSTERIVDTAEQRRNLEWRLSDLRSRIAPLEEEKRALETERQNTARRLDDLKKEGSVKAVNNLQDPLVKWREYLLPEDRSWLVGAEPKLPELDNRIKRLEEDLRPLKNDERYLEQRIRELN